MTVATPISRPTYGGWLDQIAEQGRTDDYGRVASAWAAAKASGRPKLSAVRSVNAWLSEHPPPGVAGLQATLHQLSQAYHEAGGLDQQQPAPPAGMPVAPSAPPPDMRRLGYEAGSPQEVPGQQPLWPADGQQPVQPAGPQQPVQPADVPSSQVTVHAEPGDQNVAIAFGQVPEHPWQMVLLAIGRLETLVTQFWQAADPLIRLAAEAMAAGEALDASQLAASPQASAVQEIADAQGWTAGPAFETGPAAPDFYGGHVVPAPDFASMAQASDGSEEDAG
jgi:rhodanese-related sulfurtransferase